MIVKNEITILERCLRALVDQIECWIICDTGSTDGTPELIERFFHERGIPGELHRFPFENFGQARNEALVRARRSPLSFDYLLLTDADMELVVHDPTFRQSLVAPAYRVIQRNSISYQNLRLVRREAPGSYQGVTHEFLDMRVVGVETLSGISFIDHASGSNRADKFARDIRLLREGIEAEPESARYYFYLAESYRYAGLFEKAARAYAHRVTLGGWDEEVWYAMLSEARCLRALGREGEFIGKALAAWEKRPHRAEPLRDVANHYRMRGMNHAAAMVAERGLDIPYPKDDALFIEDEIYNGGLQEDYAISAWYSALPVQKTRGRQVCDALSLSRPASRGRRDTARRNLVFYARSLAEVIEGVVLKRLEPALDPGWSPMNPSIALWRGELWMVQRTVNYTLANGHYATADGGPVSTRNVLAALDRDLAIASWTEILPPVDQPEPIYPHVRGFEDMRLIALGDELWCSSTVREMNREGWCEQVLMRIDGAGRDGPCHLAALQRISAAEPRRHEKNWTPQVIDGALRFINTYDGSLVVSRYGSVLGRNDGDLAVDHLRGGSQAVPFLGGWLALCHEVAVTGRRRCYLHRFAWFDGETTLKRLSEPFKFGSEDVEFVAGLAAHPDGRSLVVSYGVADRESWLAVLSRARIAALLELPMQDHAGAPDGPQRRSPEDLSPDRGSALGFPPIDPRPAAPATRPTAGREDPAGAIPTEPTPRHIIWIASYPKSGNTWVRAFLHNLLAELRGEAAADINRLHEHTAWETPVGPFEQVMGKALDAAAPEEIAAARPAVQRRLAASRSRPFLAKTHNAAVQDFGHPTIDLDATLAAVYVVRNPLDVVISYAHHTGRTVDETIATMARTGLRSMMSKRSAYEVLGAWSEHAASWMGLFRRPVHLLRYEDLLADPLRHFGALARFLCLTPRPDQLRSAVEQSSFAALARQEQASGFRERPASSERFFREGREGQWRTALSDAQVRRMLDAHAPMMQRLGYLEATCGALEPVGLDLGGR